MPARCVRETLAPTPPPITSLSRVPRRQLLGHRTRNRPGRRIQSTVELVGDRATGESYTIAHHLFTADGECKIMIASLRYLDTFVKVDGAWLFADRNLILDWSETRPSTP